MRAARNNTPPNRLARATSPYLRQHAHNPVDWFPWCEEALRKAEREDKPIFLSIGYSACHWCHVMERESFEDKDTAALLNAHFVSIKVDREERPDLDELYMSAVQLTTQNGGWPMSVFLTPERMPFYCGTYFPPSDQHGRPGFQTVLRALAKAWREQRDFIRGNARQLTECLRLGGAGRPEESAPIRPDLIRHAAAALSMSFDPEHGGWGGAPKFPAPASIATLLRHAWRHGDSHALAMASSTLEAMARGGIHDHLGGGFHRYAVDAAWHVPHFEKMLYDNAQLAAAYLEGYQCTKKSLFRETAEGIFRYVLRDLISPEGGFFSSEDADSDGQEGMFYLWKRDELDAVLGKDDAALFAHCYNVRPEGNFDSPETRHAGMNILRRAWPIDPHEAVFCGMEATALEAALEPMRTRLFNVRAQRARPGRDDKAIASWNGMMIAAFARGAQALHEPRYAEAARRAAGFTLERLRHDGLLARSYRDGATSAPGFLDDYAQVASALVDLYETEFDARWLREAKLLADRMIALFWDREAGGFFSAPHGQEDLIARLKPVYDTAEPSGNAAAATLLLRLAAYFDNAEYRKTAEIVLEQNAALLETVPQAMGRMLCAADQYLHPPTEIVLVGPRSCADVQRMVRALHEHFLPNKVVALADAEDDDPVASRRRPWAAVNAMQRGAATALVCSDFTCLPPLATPEALAQALEKANGRTHECAHGSSSD